MRRFLTATLCVLTAGAASMALAQRPIDNEARVNTTENILEARDQRQQVTGELAAWLAASNYAEVELGRMASEKAQHPEVQEFAKTIVDDHTMMLNKLREFIPQADIQDRNDTNTAAEREEIANQQHDVMMEVGRTAAAYELRMTKQLLERYEGQDFAMGFLGQQLVAHIEMLATMEAMKNHGSDEFQQVVAGGIEKVKGHFQVAHQLAKKLEDEEFNRGRTSDGPINRLRPDLKSSESTPDVDVTTPDVDVAKPSVDVSGPDVDVTVPDVDVTVPQKTNPAEVKKENFDLPPADIKPRATIKEDAQEDDLDLTPESGVQP